MPDSPSGFVDFNQYYDQNQDEETRLMQEAMDRARGYDAKAQSALGRSQQEAKGHFNAHGVNAGEYTDSQADITRRYTERFSRSHRSTRSRHRQEWLGSMRETLQRREACVTSRPGPTRTFKPRPPSETGRLRKSRIEPLLTRN